MGRAPVKVQINVREFRDASEVLSKFVGVTLTPTPPVMETVTRVGRDVRAESNVGVAPVGAAKFTDNVAKELHPSKEVASMGVLTPMSVTVCKTGLLLQKLVGKEIEGDDM
jgi:hypothetical protein